MCTSRDTCEQWAFKLYCQSNNATDNVLPDTRLSNAASTPVHEQNGAVQTTPAANYKQHSTNVITIT